jgi:hypothetical protein
MSIFPDYNTKNGKDYVGDKPLVTLEQKDGLVYINGRNLIEVLENSSADMELVRKTFVKICVTPNLAAAAVELKKEGYVPIQMFVALSAIFNMELMQARILFDDLCYPALVEYREKEFNTNLNNKIIALHKLAAIRPLEEAEQLELSIFERLQATDDINVVRGIRGEIQVMNIDPVLQKNLLQMIGEKRDLC